MEEDNGPSLPTRVRDVIGFISGSVPSDIRHEHVLDDQRAVGLGEILSHGAHIFSPGVQATPKLFARSRPVALINYFVSHSWSAPRFDKYAGLLYRFNLVPALVAMHLVALVTALGFVAGVLPPMATLACADLPGVRVPFGAYCQLAGTAAFVSVLIGWGRVMALVEAMGLIARTDCFVDKMCINQHDSDAKARGIDQIGRFLRNSEELLILWSPDYFMRLWCCFEVAVYLHFLRLGDNEPGALQRQSSAQTAQQQRKLEIVPLPLAKFGLLLAAIYTLGPLSFRLLMLAYDVEVYGFWYTAIHSASVVLSCIPMSLFFREFAAQRRELDRQLQSFTFSEARSYSEEDRSMLREIISEMYNGSGAAGAGVPAFSPDDDGIVRFERKLRWHMPAVVNELMGRPSVLPPKLLALFSSTLWLFCLDGIAARAILPVAVFGGARGQALYLASYTASLLAFSFGVILLMSNTSIALGIQLQRTRVTFGGELGVYALMILVPAAVFISGDSLCQFLWLRLPIALSIPANLFVLGVALALNTVRRSPCRRQGTDRKAAVAVLVLH
ncbi:hypothetical protein T492DRAFT_1098658 [Pavlovales sp. CCMP2436]|nr:hypothetical protein T492DRAFT_1098658 [Pavlovales sp. CCMP2436]